MQLTYLNRYLLINMLSFIFPFDLKEEYRDWDLGVLNNLRMTCKRFKYFFDQNQHLINFDNFDVILFRWRYDSGMSLGKEMYFLSSACLNRRYFFLEKYGEILNGRCSKQDKIYPVKTKMIVDSLASDIRSKIFVN